MTTQESLSETLADSSLSACAENLMEEATNLNYRTEIETVIAGMAQDRKVMVGTGEQGHLWKFHYGTVEVFVQLTGETNEDTFTVWSLILPLPAKNEPQLMRQLMEMNWLKTFEAHFAIADHQIAVVASRSVAELSPSEIARLITIVATIADENDEPLQAEFSA